MSTSSVCALCGEEDIIEFLNLGRQPLANKYPRGEEDFKKEDFFPLAVFFCPRCRNVQLGTAVSRARMFEDYYYLSSVNPGLVRHFEGLAQELAGSRFVVDIGSNDGILLKPLKELAVKALGVDPSINVSKIANDAGLETIVSFFTRETAQEIKQKYGAPDVVVASSIVTHLENPHPFIEAVKNLMDDNGRFIVEVEYIGNILKNVQFERFYLDRVFYYSLASLKSLFEAHGMRVADVEEIEPHGGSLRVSAVKNGYPGSASGTVSPFLEEEKTVLTLTALQEFKSRVDSHIAALCDKLFEYRNSCLKVAGYGAPARLATISNYGRIGQPLIDFVVDDSPLKQNRFSPGMHIPIVPGSFLEEHKPDVLVVFAHEYFDDIKKKTGGAYRYLLPIPPREVS
jgi:hypothetical protein